MAEAAGIAAGVGVGGGDAAAQLQRARQSRSLPQLPLTRLQSRFLQLSRQRMKFLKMPSRSNPANPEFGLVAKRHVASRCHHRISQLPWRRFTRRLMK